MKLPDIHHWFYVPIVCVVAYYFVQTQRDTRALIQHADKAAALSNDTLVMFNATLKGKHANGDDGLLFRTNLLVANADSAVNALKQTAQQINKASKENAPKSNILADESIATVRAGKEAMGQLDASLNTLNAVIGLTRDVTLPKINNGIDSLNRVVTGLEPAEKSADALLVSTNGVMTALRDTVLDADKLIADPDLAATAKNISAASASSALAMAHVEKATGYIEKDLSPKNIPLWQTLIEGAIGNAISIPFKRISQSVNVTNAVTTK